LFLQFYDSPRGGEVYNLGGGRENSLSILETIEMLKARGFNLDYQLREENRVGDHICYISDLAKIRTHYPKWTLKHDVPTIIDEMVVQYRSLGGRKSV
jgi:CDP-paratose 2-epimerase